MAELRDLLSITNSYLSKNKSKPSVYVLDMVTGYVNRMLTLFGIKHDSLKTSENVEEVLMPVLNVLSGFRDMVRKLAQAKADPTDILRLCDKMRDVDLVEIGVVLDDQAGMIFIEILLDDNRWCRIG
jgi:cysteinyl-tRNA synthetase